MVRVAQRDSEIALTWRYEPQFVSRRTRGAVRVSPEDWERLQLTFERKGFWQLQEEPNRLILDGASWLIERRQHDLHHAVTRRSPAAELQRIGHLLFLLAGAPLSQVELY
jgi:hypothetical protein